MEAGASPPKPVAVEPAGEGPAEEVPAEDGE